jgi:F-box/leucine-rich repeat protein 7
MEHSTDGDSTMFDAPPESPTPPISDLRIADRGPKSPTKKDPVPAVTFNFPFGQPPPENALKPSRIEERGVMEPFDPDPYLNTDLDNLRSRSRRSSLAPPAPDQANSENNKPETQTTPISQTTISTRTYVSRPAKAKHVTTPPEHYSKRPKTSPQRRPTRFSMGPLPDKLLVQIFRHCDVYELMCLRRVSMHWCRLLTTSPEVLHTLDLRKYNRRVTDHALITTICPFVGPRPLMVDISNCFHITDEGFTFLAAMCGLNVRTWKMKSVWDITAQAVLEMANKAKLLEDIDLSNCRKVSDNLLARVVGWVVQETPQYQQQLQAQQQQQQQQQQHMQQQQQQNGSRRGSQPPSRPGHQQHPSQSSAPQAAPPGTVIGCPKLKRLTLSYCKHVTDRSMAHLAVHASSRLEEVDLTRCTTITDQGFQHWSIYQFSRLTKLCLADCTYLTDNAIVYLTNAAKGLRELDLVSPALPLSSAL